MAKRFTTSIWGRFIRSGCEAALGIFSARPGHDQCGAAFGALGLATGGAIWSSHLCGARWADDAYGHESTSMQTRTPQKWLTWSGTPKCRGKNTRVPSSNSFATCIIPDPAGTRNECVGIRRSKDERGVHHKPRDRGERPSSSPGRGLDHRHDAGLERLGQIGPSIHHGGQVGVIG